MVTEHYGDLRIDWTDGEYQRLQKARGRRDTYKNIFGESLYFAELARIRESELKLISDCADK